MIELSNIAKKFNDQVVLNDISLSVGNGEIMVLLGPSGCGKTTQLKIIAGLMQQDSGDIMLNNKIINHLPPQERHIGFVFQDYALFPHKNVFENIAFGLEIRKLSKKEIASKVFEIMETLEIKELKEQKIARLSGGQKQRVALARAVVTGPKVLLLDEPLSALDPILREKLRVELKNMLRNIGITGIYVTHDLTEAMIVGDKIAIINEGEIQQIGTPDEVLYRPKTEFVAKFVGFNNILKGQVVGWHADQAIIEISSGTRSFKINTLKYPVFERWQELQFCINPEDVILSSKKEDHSISGIITGIIPSGPVIKIIIDVAGLELWATVARRLLKHQLNDPVWVSFSKNALYPLCGKKSSSPVQAIPAACVKPLFSRFNLYMDG